MVPSHLSISCVLHMIRRVDMPSRRIYTVSLHSRILRISPRSRSSSSQDVLEYFLALTQLRTHRVPRSVLIARVVYSHLLSHSRSSPTGGCRVQLMPGGRTNLENPSQMMRKSNASRDFFLRMAKSSTRGSARGRSLWRASPLQSLSPIQLLSLISLSSRCGLARRSNGEYNNNHQNSKPCQNSIHIRLL